MSKQSKTQTGILIGAIAILALLGIWGISNLTGTSSSNVAQARTATIYKSPTCGCCGQYVAYLKSKGYDVDVIDERDMGPIKEQFGIPNNMESCHTTVIDEYVFEGHIPVEAIEQFLIERPDSEGIALPGMPSGSPGMPGIKREPFQIYSLNSGQSEPYKNL